jgi:hypothetical protein
MVRIRYELKVACRSNRVSTKYAAVLFIYRSTPPPNFHSKMETTRLRSPFGRPNEVMHWKDRCTLVSDHEKDSKNSDSQASSLIDELDKRTQMKLPNTIPVDSYFRLVLNRRLRLKVSSGYDRSCDHDVLVALSRQ